jgi:nitroreductase
MMTMIETIQIRKSCRTYADRAIEPAKLAELREFLAAATGTPFGSRVRFHLLNFSELETGELKKLTTYGIIKGASHFLVGAVEKGPGAMEDCGYAMEGNILKATAMGLGTCILGGTFSRSGFAGKIGIAENEVLPVISPVGYPREKRSAVDRLFRFVASSDRRKPWDELFYLGTTGTALTREDGGSFGMPLECVRLAPSASNKQPWRVVKSRERDAFYFYLKRTPGYEKLTRGISLQNVDMGIAMGHFEWSARELGLAGGWTTEDPKIETPGLEYIASWLSA